MELFQLILAIAGGISVIGSAGLVIIRVIRPAFRLQKRVKVLEERVQSDLRIIEEIKETNYLLCEGILRILENTITGNSVENLKVVKTKIQDFLIRK